MPRHRHRQSAGRSRTRRPVRRRRRPKGVMTAAWGALSAVFTVAFLAVQGTALLVAMLLSLVIAGITAVAEFSGAEIAVPDVPRKTAGKPNPRGNSKPRRRKPASGPHKQVCSARCRRSAPSSPCECVCGGKQWVDAGGKKQGHGSEHR